MSQIKKKHVRSKTVLQIFLMFLEIAVIVGGLTWAVVFYSRLNPDWMC